MNWALDYECVALGNDHIVVLQGIIWTLPAPLVRVPGFPSSCNSAIGIRLDQLLDCRPSLLRFLITIPLAIGLFVGMVTATTVQMIIIG